jgi:hypothetical protein
MEKLKYIRKHGVKIKHYYVYTKIFVQVLF